MTSGKDTTLKYCSQYSQSSIEHIENCIWNKNCIEQGDYSKLEGCPSTYGLEFEGLCFTEEVVENAAQSEQCERCWRQALNMNTDES